MIKSSSREKVGRKGEKVSWGGKGCQEPFFHTFKPFFHILKTKISATQKNHRDKFLILATFFISGF